MSLECTLCTTRALVSTCCKDHSIVDMFRFLPLILLAVVPPCVNVAAFQPSPVSLSVEIPRQSRLTATRREVVETGARTTMGSILALSATFVTIAPKQVLASGGATAGGAYLLSVRLRS